MSRLIGTRYQQGPLTPKMLREAFDRIRNEPPEKKQILLHPTEYTQKAIEHYKNHGDEFACRFINYYGCVPDYDRPLGEQIETANQIISEQIKKTAASIKHSLTVYRESERAEKNRAKRRRKKR